MVSAALNIRGRSSALVRKHRWLPLAGALGSGAGLIVALAAHANPPVVLGVAAALTLSSYVWGYGACAFKQISWPSLADLSRRQYAEVWDSLATSERYATAATRGIRDQDIPDLLQLASISPQDEVLEIGCGVGRLGLGLAAHCRHWTGADISSKVLAYASDRLSHLRNATFIHLSDVGLGGLGQSSFDVIYSIDVFAHLEEIDRWKYVQDASRVLRPGGRLYIENIDLESEEGWAMFANHASRWVGHERLPYDTTFSTGAELMAYVNRAGFAHVRTHRRSPRVVVTAIKRRQGEQ